ncbi:MAG: DNA recombination protein RmuC [Candidatus Omnitrophica bacterium]|nr:DNA recombination protein RmuC [Candidatus Omnitrophota bacterium]
MEFLTLILAIIGTAAVVTSLWLWRSGRTAPGPTPEDRMAALRQEMAAAQDRQSQLMLSSMDGLRSQMTEQLGGIMSEVNKRLAESTDQLVKSQQGMGRVFGEVQEKLGGLEKSTAQVLEISKDISSLQDLLKPPKLRGALGEYLLEGLLSEILPNKSMYSMQYRFRSNEVVDAVIHIDQRIVPVDAKFPIESFRRLTEAEGDAEKKSAHRAFETDVKKHIDAISSKYILPDERTFDFALMYIPAENVYYETILKDEGLSEEKGIFHHAMAHRVIPVSPNSLYAYLQVIVLGLRGLAVERHAEEILKNLRKLHGHFESCEESFVLTGKQLEHALNNYKKAETHLRRFSDKLAAVEESAEETPVLTSASAPRVEPKNLAALPHSES